jgi:hypothetical protein
MIYRQILAFSEDMRAEAEDAFIVSLSIFIIVEKPFLAAMGQPSIGLFSRIRMKPEYAAGFPVRAPGLDVELARIVQRRDNHVALFRVTGRKAGIACELKRDAAKGHDQSPDKLSGQRQGRSAARLEEAAAGAAKQPLAKA